MIEKCHATVQIILVKLQFMKKWWRQISIYSSKETYCPLYKNYSMSLKLMAYLFSEVRQNWTNTNHHTSHIRNSSPKAPVYEYSDHNKKAVYNSCLYSFCRSSGRWILTQIRRKQRCITSNSYGAADGNGR